MASRARNIVRRMLGERAIFVGRAQLQQVREQGIGDATRWNVSLLDAWVRDRRARSRYDVLSEERLRAARRSHKVFIFGSGASINDLHHSEWEHFAEHDVFGFNEFFRQRWVRVDFQLLRAGVYGEHRWRAYMDDTIAHELLPNPLYENTVYLMPRGIVAGEFSNRLLGWSYLPADSKVFRYPIVRGDGPPKRTFGEGIRHFAGTLAQTVNCAYCMGWNEIVLVGVDLYDSRYFWLPPNETVAIDEETGRVTSGEYNNIRGIRFDEMHSTVNHGLVETLGRWRHVLARAGVTLSVYNPRSLLAQRLPVYDRSTDDR